jgi:hypothetical protein
MAKQINNVHGKKKRLDKTTQRGTVMAEVQLTSAEVVEERSYIIQFGDYLAAKRRDGIISPSDVTEIMQSLVGVLGAAGNCPDRDPVVRPVIRHAIHIAQRKLLKLHPELAGEVARLGPDEGICR